MYYVKKSLTFLDFAIMAVRLFPDNFTGTLPQKTLDGGFRKANRFADTYRFGGGKRGRQEGKAIRCAAGPASRLPFPALYGSPWHGNIP